MGAISLLVIVQLMAPATTSWARKASRYSGSRLKLFSPTKYIINCWQCRAKKFRENLSVTCN